MEPKNNTKAQKRHEHEIDALLHNLSMMETMFKQLIDKMREDLLLARCHIE